MVVAILKRLCGEVKAVRALDPVVCLPTKERVRVLRREPDGLIAVADNAGRELPDLWHHTQLRAY
jgi:hypothetical protein